MKNPCILLFLVSFCMISFAQDGEYPLPYVQKEPAYDIAPSFPGGIDALNNFFRDSIRYPEPEKSKGLHGYVILKFMVTKEGKIEKIQPVNGVPGAPNFVKESIRLIESMPLWIPASKNKMPIDAEYNMNVPFYLGD